MTLESGIKAKLRWLVEKLGKRYSVNEEVFAELDDATAGDWIEAKHDSRLTTDPADPRLGHGVDKAPVAQNEVYLVLSEEERGKGFIRPVRTSYVHKCGAVTTMGLTLSETYARNPKFYGSTYCISCRQHLLVSEFKWVPDGEVVGS